MSEVRRYEAETALYEDGGYTVRYVKRPSGTWVMAADYDHMQKGFNATCAHIRVVEDERAALASRLAQAEQREATAHELRNQLAEENSRLFAKNLELSARLAQAEQRADTLRSDRDLAIKRIAQLEQRADQANAAYELVSQDCRNLTEKVIPALRERAADAEKERDECFDMVCKLLPLDRPSVADIEWARREIAALAARSPEDAGERT